MHAVLRDINSPDVDLDTYWPEDPENFGFYLELYIGTNSEEGRDQFGIIVCTPNWIKDNFIKGSFGRFGRPLLIVDEYHLQNIKDCIAKYCSTVTGDKWLDIALELNKVAYWEFENYKH